MRSTSNEAQLSLRVPTVNAILTNSGIRDEDLDVECSDEHITQIATKLERWEYVARFLKFSETEIEDILCNNSLREVQRMKLLKRWKKRFAFNATYRALVETFCKCELMELAEYVCSLLKSNQQGRVNTHRLWADVYSYAIHFQI